MEESARSRRREVRVSEIMQMDLITCAPTDSVTAVARTMHAHSVGAVLVMDGPRLAGIFTERDLVRLVAEGSDARERPVAAMMSCDVCMAPPDADLLWAADMMRRRRVRHLPVGDDGMVVGIVSLRDLFVFAESVLRLDPDGAETARDVLAAASG
jgi:CBS domain-containing protein